MKSLFSLSSYLTLGILCAIGFCPAALGQQNQYYAKAEEQRGYWNLKTDYASRQTQVRFYNADSQLVYQEALSNQFIKLTSANIRRLDQTLARLVDNQLVSSNIEASEIPQEGWRLQRAASPRTEVKVAEPQSLSSSGLSVRFLSPNSQKHGMFVFVDNPARERVTVTIRSEENVILYEQITRQAADPLFLNMSGMPAGKYRVRVVSATKEAEVPVSVSYSNRIEVSHSVKIHDSAVPD